MHLKSIQTTGITIYNDKMLIHNQEVFTIRIQEAINQFIYFLKNLSNMKVILVAHNGFAFDFKFIIRDAYRYNFDIAFKFNIFGFVDSLNLIKDKINKPSYSLENLSKELIPNYNLTTAHNAIFDVRCVKKVLQNLGFNQIDLAKNCIEFSVYETKSKISNILNYN